LFEFRGRETLSKFKGGEEFFGNDEKIVCLAKATIKTYNNSFWEQLISKFKDLIEQHEEGNKERLLLQQKYN
jgi:hypothetical protein